MSAISGLSGAALPATQLTQLLTDVGFSAVVNGKSYSAGVAYWDGAYVATDGNITGATAGGSSIEAAENNLTNRIDIMV
jgi:hypothetical protein